MTVGKASPLNDSIFGNQALQNHLFMNKTEGHWAVLTNLFAILTVAQGSLRSICIAERIFGEISNISQPAGGACRCLVRLTTAGRLPQCWCYTQRILIPACLIQTFLPHPLASNTDRQGTSASACNSKSFQKHKVHNYIHLSRELWWFQTLRVN